MEVLSTGFAIASLSIQLIDGVQRFQLFFEECRDPTIDIHGLVDQLHAVRHLCEIVEEATKPGSEGALACGVSLKDELGRCRSRLQELTDLVMKFEASLPRLLTDQPRWKPRWKNYMKIHSQQKKIQRYATKLDRTRTTVLDHFHITVLDQLRSMQSPSPTAGTIPSSDPSYCEKVADEIDFYPHEQQQKFAPQIVTASETTSTAHNSSVASHARGSIAFNHYNGTGYFNMNNTQSINTNSRGNITMFKQGRKKTKEVRQKIPEQIMADASEQRADAEQQRAGLKQMTGESYNHQGYAITVETHSSENTFFNDCNEQIVKKAQGKVMMFDQTGNDTDEE